MNINYAYICRVKSRVRQVYDLTKMAMYITDRNRVEQSKDLQGFAH